MSVAAWREQFPLLEQQENGRPLVYWDNAATTQKPTTVLDALADFYRTHNANVHRGLYGLGQRATQAYEEARQDVARFVRQLLPTDDRPEDAVVFTRGTTESINLVAAGLADLVAGTGRDEVVISEQEHHANIVPWQMACRRLGWRLRALPVTDEGRWDLAAGLPLIGPKTALVAVAHVSNALGIINPLAEVVRAARRIGAAVLVDGAQAAAHRLPLPAGVDFYAFSGHKVFAPTGVGVLWGRRERLDRLPPWQGGGEMIERVTLTESTYAAPPYRFEAGTPPIAGAVGLAAALRWLQGIPVAAAKDHERVLAAELAAVLDACPGIRRLGPRDITENVGIFSFVATGGLTADELAGILAGEGFCVRSGQHCTQPLWDRLGQPATVRASLSLYNTVAEIERFAPMLSAIVTAFA